MHKQLILEIWKETTGKHNQSIQELWQIFFLKFNLILTCKTKENNPSITCDNTKAIIFLIVTGKTLHIILVVTIKINVQIINA